MPAPIRGRRRRALPVVAATLLAAAAIAQPAVAVARPAHPTAHAAPIGLHGHHLDAALRHAHGPTRVMLELAGSPATVASPQLSATDTDHADCIHGPRGYACSSVLVVDAPGTRLQVRDDTGNHTDHALGLLLLHHDNTTGNRMQVVPVQQRTATRLTVSHTSVPYRARVTATVHVAVGSGTYLPSTSAPVRLRVRKRGA